MYPIVLRMPRHEREPSSAWPPSNGLTTHVVPRNTAILSVYGSTLIAAPASLVWEILLDLSGYSAWNTFCPRATIHSQPQNVPASERDRLHKDTKFTFHVVMDPSKPSKITDTQLRVTDVSTPQAQSEYLRSGNQSVEEKTYTADLKTVFRISWTTEGGFVARGLKSERFHEIIHLDDDSCEVRTWENQGGILARAVKFYYKDVLMTKFQEWCVELKSEAERRYDGQKQGTGFT